jgi:hypothetical protein
MLSREMHGYHLRQRIYIEPISYASILKCCDNRHGQLLEQRIQDGKSRHNLSSRYLASVHFIDRGCVNRIAQINLKDFRMPGMLPLGGSSSRRHANPTGADESSLTRRPGDLAGDRRWMTQMVDQKRMANARFDCFKRGFFDDGSIE